MTDRLVDQIAAELARHGLTRCATEWCDGDGCSSCTEDRLDAAKAIASLPALARVDQMREALGALVRLIEAAHLSGDHDFNALRYSVPFEDAAELLALLASPDAPPTNAEPTAELEALNALPEGGVEVIDLMAQLKESLGKAKRVRPDAPESE